MSHLILEERFNALLPHADADHKAASTLRRLARKLSSEEGYASLVRLGRDLARLEELEPSNQALSQDLRLALESVREWMQAEWVRRAAESTTDLLRFFEDRGWEGTPTDKGVRFGPIEVRASVEKDEAKLYHAGEQLQHRRLGLEPDSIYRAWVQVQDKLARQATPPDVLAELLVTAYQSGADEPGRTARRVRVPELHFQLFVGRQTAAVRADPRGGRIKEYPRYQFAWDLAGLLAEGEPFQTPAGSLHFSAATDSSARSRAKSVVVLVNGARRVLGGCWVE